MRPARRGPRARLAAVAGWLALSVATALGARATPPPMEPLPRKVMVLIDTREGDDFEDNDVQRLLGMPMYHLGLRPVFYDLAAGPPSDVDMAAYRGVLGYRYQLDCEPELRRWFHAQTRAGRKILLLASLEPDVEPVAPECEETDEDWNRFYEPYGLHYSSLLTSEGAEDKVQVRRAGDGWFGFEQGFDTQPFRPYEFLRSVGRENDARLTAWIDGVEDSDSDLVVTGPWGGMAVTQYLWAPRTGRDYPAYLVDPFRLIEAAFRWEGMPRVEANVLNGKRVFFSHVDGDGFNSFAYDRPSKICGEIVYDEILNDPEFAGLPHTISLISAEVDPATTHPVAASIPTARRVFDLEQVESASHAFSHPMDWREGTLAFEDIVLDGRPYRFDRRKETVGSLETIAALAPPDRKPEVMLWSGSCNPDRETLRITRKAGYFNMNGGDPRLDDQFDSLTQVAPPVWQVVDELRFSSGAANDYLMTNEWTPPFTGYRGITETFRRTGRPRPLTPVDVYYHFYIAERAESFQTLKSVFRWCKNQDLALLFTSEYLAAMRDLVEARLTRGPGGWWGAETKGRLPSLRFDGETRHVDMAAAEGVLGYAHKWDSLYVFLDHTGRHRFRLTPEPQTARRLVAATRPLEMLAPAAGELLAFRARGTGVSTFRFAGLPPGQYVAMRREGGPANLHAEEILQVSPQGGLTLAVALGLGATVRVRGSTVAAAKIYEWNLWFAGEGRFLLLGATLALLGWLLCRFYLPLLRPGTADVPVAPRRRPGGGEGGLEVDAADDAAMSGGLPAGGVGPWAGGAASRVDDVDAGDGEGGA